MQMFKSIQFLKYFYTSLCELLNIIEVFFNNIHFLSTELKKNTKIEFLGYFFSFDSIIHNDNVRQKKNHGAGMLLLECMIKKVVHI